MSIVVASILAIGIFLAAKELSAGIQISADRLAEAIELDEGVD